MSDVLSDRFPTLVRRTIWRALRSGSFPLSLGLCVLLVSCGDPHAVRVQLQARNAPAGQSTPRLEIQAQVTGPQAGLRYKWFALSGQCDPQSSDWPMTYFTFSGGSKRDRVTVEIWRGSERVAQSEITVDYQRMIDPMLPADANPAVDITISTVPRAEAGGDDTRADIAGVVKGHYTPEHRIVIYARAYGTWFVQPSALATHPIQPDGTWATWTHTGESYAALIVGPDYVPVPRLDLLPQLGDQVLARTVVDGVPAVSTAKVPAR